MLMIRLQRIGRRNDPAYRIAVLEKARAARTGRVVEALGSYNPKTKAFALDEARTKELIAHGAQPTDTLRNLFITKGIMEGKKVDVFPLSARKSAREAAAKAEADAIAAKKVEAAAVAAAPAEMPSAAEAQEASVEAPAAEAPVEAAAADAAPEAPVEEPTSAKEEPAA